MRTLRSIVPAVALALTTLAIAAPAHADPAAVRKAMEDEMARSLEGLRLGASGPPYYLRYTIIDGDHARVSARLGSLVESTRNKGRFARIDARVGSPAEDNTNFMFASSGTTAGVSQEDDYAALRRDLWLLTDHEYKQVLDTLARKKASHAVQSTEKDKLDDFAPAPVVQSVVDRPLVIPDDGRAKVEALVVNLSRIFREYPTVNSGIVEAGMGVIRRRLLTSEKTWADEGWTRVEVDVSAETVAEDGQRLYASLRFSSVDVAGLPGEVKMAADIRALAKNLAAQRTAPTVDAGTATVLFEDQAAAQLARLLFTSPLSGQPIPRMVGEAPRDGSSSFADKFGLRVAPTWLNVVDDPLGLGPGKRGLYGNYHVDDEGVAAERVPLIDHGVVKGLLMSRTPRKEIKRSNGHGRSGEGVVRGLASTVFVTTQGGLGHADLLAAAVRSAGPGGTVYVVRQLGESSAVGRGQTLDARVAFRYKDGKEEVVRGLSLEGFSPRKLKKDLIASGRDPVVYEESSGSPVSVVSPALLFEDVDVGKPNDKNKRPPLYPSPLAEAPVEVPVIPARRREGP
jgi:predicted Zn-dependent protease